MLVPSISGRADTVERGYQDDEADRRGGKAARRHVADGKLDFAVIRAFSKPL
jgi:hypothetical protein